MSGTGMSAVGLANQEIEKPLKKSGAFIRCTAVRQCAIETPSDLCHTIEIIFLPLVALKS
jgi:hypothetical protein